MNVAFLFSFFLATGLALLALPYAKRRPAGKPTTWGEAMLGAVYVFALMFVAYGVVPNQWLLWADNELKWRADRVLLDTYPITVSYLVLRDLIAVAIYAVFLGGQIALWAVWQGRGKQKQAAELPTSTFGRPLVKKA